MTSLSDRAPVTGATTDDASCTAEPLGPGSIFWRFTGDWRQGYLTSRLIVLQGSYPGVAAGIEQHSVYKTDPYGRLSRTLDSVLKQVYGGAAAAAEGRRVRELHRAIKGVDEQGRRYSALKPDAYLWVHATTFEQALVFFEKFDTALTEAEVAQLFDEWKRLGLLLGIRQEHLPQTLAEFWEMWHEGLKRLENTPLIQDLLFNAPPPPPGFPAWLWPAVSKSYLDLRRLVLAWTVSAELLDLLGLPPVTARQLRKLHRLQRNTRLAGRLPARLRYIPQAWAARQEALAALGDSA